MSTSGPQVENLLSQLPSQDSKTLPPVESWNPPYCGEMDMVIRSNGEWLHSGTPIGRKKLYKLFSTIILKKDDDYFLVTPVEKIKITVDWQPFVIVDFERVEINGTQCYQFIDNCENLVQLTSTNQLQFSEFEGLLLPIINIRRNLFASFSRSCYYRLLEQAKIIEGEKTTLVQIESAGLRFNLGEYIEEN